MFVFALLYAQRRRLETRAGTRSLNCYRQHYPGRPTLLGNDGAGARPISRHVHTTGRTRSSRRKAPIATKCGINEMVIVAKVTM